MRRHVKAMSAVFVSGALCRAAASIGQERSLPRHLADGEELTLSPQALIAWGSRLFQANWTIQDGAGRPRTKGNGQSLSPGFEGNQLRPARP